MALFNRKNRTNVPEEIQEYYQTERRERAGIAWLLAFGTLVVTIVLAAGIFFAGRWAYRKIAGSDNGSTQVAQNEQKQQGEQGTRTPDNSSEQTEEERRAAEEPQRQEEADRKAAEERQAEEKRQAEQERKKAAERERAEQQQREEAAAGGSGGQQVASAGDSIPSTGPGDTVAIFLGATVVGYVLHLMIARKQQ
jgi:flagellar motor protein MotB